MEFQQEILNLFFNNTSLTKTDKTDSFSDVLSAAMGSIGETNDLQNAAAQEEVRFALGESDNTHDLLCCGNKGGCGIAVHCCCSG